MKFILFIFLFNILHAISLFELVGEEMVMEIMEGSKLCNVKYVNPISTTHKNYYECTEMRSSLEDTINNMKINLKNKKEIIFAFYNNKTAIQPNLKTSLKEWKLASVIYNYKDNTYRFELYDKEGKYYYFEKDISSIKLQINPK